MPYKVFISHSAKDNDLARDLARRLQETGSQPFLVEETAASGSNFAGTLEHGLKASDEVIVLLTESSVNSAWVMSEIGAASSLRKRITPVIVGAPDVPSVLRSFQQVKYPDLTAYLSDLRQRIAANIKTTDLVAPKATPQFSNADRTAKRIKHSAQSLSKGAKHARVTTRR